MTVPINQPAQKISAPVVVYEILSKVLASEQPEDRDQEHFWVFHLDTRNGIKSLHLVSLGTIDRAIVHPREVFTRAIADRCCSIVIAHNHPSHDASPSSADVDVTQQLVKAGEILGIKVLDHVIVAGDKFYSFRQENCL